MTGKRPRLYPSHQHQWIETHQPTCDVLDHGVAIPGPCTCTPTARCTVCGFTAPRNLANLDGKPAGQQPHEHDWRATDSIHPRNDVLSCAVCGQTKRETDA